MNSSKGNFINKKFILSFFILLFFISIQQISFSSQKNTLKDVYKDDFLIGVAIGSRDIFHYYKYPMRKDKSEMKIINREFNCVTAENLMKPQYISPHPGMYYFEAVDELMDFAEKNNHVVVGHVLVWHAMTADSFFEDDKGNLLSRDDMILRMKDYIYQVVKRYKGRIKYWDVVNEAVDLRTITDENGNRIEEAFFRESKWTKIIGEDFIELAFKFAHEADPNAELIYNDFTMNNEVKAKFVSDMCKRIRSKGIRIDGVGMQAHWHLNYPSVEELKHVMRIYRESDLKVHLTELDVGILERPNVQQDADISRKSKLNSSLNPYTNNVPSSVLIKHAKKYEDLFKVLLENRDIVDRVTFWGANDGISWLNEWPIQGRTSHPLLFDRFNQPKPAYDTLISLGLEFQRN